MRKVRSLADASKGVSTAVDLEVESAPTGTIVRFVLEDGEALEIELDTDNAIKHAATVMFCAMRHTPDHEAAVDRFMHALADCAKQLHRQAFGSAPAPKGRPS